jgi:drug/metabolite transporter (DMT)-like permease
VASEPLLVAALAARMDPSQRPSSAQLAGLLLGLAGVAALLGVDVGTAPAQLAGSVAILAAVACYAAAALSLRRLPTDVDATALVTASMSLAAVLLLPLGVLTAPPSAPGPAVLAALAALAVVCTALAFPIWFTLIRRVGAARASLITYVNPAIAVALGVVVLNEPITPATLVGFGLILGGCWLSTRAAAAPAGERELASAVQRT